MKFRATNNWKMKNSKLKIIYVRLIGVQVVHPKCLYESCLIIGKVNDIKLKKNVNGYFDMDIFGTYTMKASDWHFIYKVIIYLQMGILLFLLSIVFYIYFLISLFMSGSYFLFALVFVFGGIILSIFSFGLWVGLLYNLDMSHIYREDKWII